MWHDGADWHDDVGEIEQRERGVGFETLDDREAFARRLAIHFDAAFGHVDEPVVARAASCVDALLDGAVFSEGRLGDLDDQVRALGVAVIVVGERDDQEITRERSTS